MVISYLKIFTFLTKEEIEELEKSNNLEPEKRLAHKALAREIITDLHGKEEYEKALKLSETLFSGKVNDLSNEELELVFKNMPHTTSENNLNIIDFLVNTGICSSKREAREFVSSSSITINEEKINDDSIFVNKNMAINNDTLVVRKGKKKYFIVKLV